jgi:Amt family ammonium transporter
MGAIAIGLASGVGCYLAATKLKNALGFDDSLDVFGVHAIGGIIGALLTGVFAAQSLGGSVADLNIGSQVGIQALGIVATITYTGVISYIILKLLDLFMGLRVSRDEESEGLDLTLHDERGYNI